MADRYGNRYRGDTYGRDRDRRPDERGFMDRAGDEVRSWFGDDEAARRRGRDVRRDRPAEHVRDDRTRYGGGFTRSSRDYDPSWERRGGYGSDASRSSESAGRWGPEPDWHRGEGAGASYRGYTGVSSGRGWEGGYDDPDAENRGRFDTRDDERRVMGYQFPPAASPVVNETFERGRFAGRGPKGYQRSDERIREDVCDRLSDHPDIDASDIEVQVNSGEVTLSGTVRQREDKRRVEDLIERISGVHDVHNSLKVNRTEPGTPGSVLGVSPSPGAAGRPDTDLNTPGTRR